MQIKTITRIIAATLVITALLIAASLISDLTLPGTGGWLSQLGAGFLQRFLAAAFYIPVYLTACAVLLIIREFKLKYFHVLLFTLLPFITLSLFLQLVSSSIITPAGGFMIEVFGRQGGAFALLIVLMIELLILIRLVLPGTNPDSAVESRATEFGPVEEIPSENSRPWSEPVPQEVSVRTLSFPNLVSDSVPSQAGRGETDGNPALSGGFSDLLKEGLAPVLNSTVQKDEEDISENLHEDPFVREIMGEADSPEADLPVDEIGVPAAEVYSHDIPENEPDLDSYMKGDPESSTEPEVSFAWEAEEIEEIEGKEELLESQEPEDPEETGLSEESALVIENFHPEDPEDAAEFPEVHNPEDAAEFPEIEDPDKVDLADMELEEFDVSHETVEASEPEESEEHEEGEVVELEPEISDTVMEGSVPASDPAPSETVLPPKSSGPRKRKVKYDVPEDLLTVYADGQYWIVDDETRAAADVLKNTLEEFKIAAEVTGISKGPVITMFEILPAPGVKLSKIVNLADNIALGLAASSVRIVAPIPGKHAVGIEVPNKNRAIVSFKEMLESENRETRKMAIPVILGKDITGGARIIDLVQTPHLLIAGATGSGKSVCVNSLICSILYRRKPEEVKLMLIDPKIVELKLYNGIPHLLTPVITDPKRAFKALQYAIFEMERRYSLLDNLGVREIRSYNARVKEQKLATDTIPYIVIVVDEFADLMATSGKELEAVIARLAAMSRAVGIHLVLATQRPSVDVITGLIKANIPSRIAFMVASKFDSRIILDEVGAEKLLGKGDMLFTSAWDPNPVRMQGAFLSEDEAERVADHVKSLGEPDYIDDEIFLGDEDEDDFQLTADSGSDPLFETAVSIVVEAGKASASYLQRRLKVGYNRAARLVEEMEMRGIVGPANGSKPREIIHIPDLG